METLWNIINAPAVFAVLGSVMGVAIAYIIKKKPEVAAYEGTIIAAIKYAEQAIPDDAANKALARLDSALKYVIAVYEARTGNPATAAIVAAITEAIQVKHAELEATGENL